MAKSKAKTVFFCKECGYETPKWMGQCPGCHQWNTMTEEKVCLLYTYTILTRMGRRTNRAELVSLVEKLRKEIPDIVLRTTLITGFPGETEEEFNNMVDFVDSMEFDRLGVFPYLSLIHIFLLHDY